MTIDRSRPARRRVAPVRHQPPGRRVAGRRLVGDEGDAEQRGERRHRAVDGPDYRAGRESVDRQLRRRVLDGEVEVREPVSERVAGVPGQEPRGDAEPAEPRVLGERLRDQEQRRARHHRAARQSVPPDRFEGVIGRNRPSPQRRADGHGAEGGPRDGEQLPRDPRGERERREPGERDHAADADRPLAGRYRAATARRSVGVGLECRHCTVITILSRLIIFPTGRPDSPDGRAAPFGGAPEGSVPITCRGSTYHENR